MSKRSWHEANLPSPHSVPPPPTTHSGTSASPRSHQSPALSTSGSPKKAASPAGKRSMSNGAAAVDTSKMPGVSRKVKACAACRKQKIKCIMQGDPPCQRCRERGLSCKLNKSLQTLMSEDSRWKASVTKDVSALYTSDPAIFFDQDEAANEEDDDHSVDDSPKVTPITDNLSHVPIESLYQITGMRALRAAGGSSEDQARYCKQLRDTDFISRGVVKIEDAEPLARYFLEKLDPYIWHVCRQYTDLESFRSRSPTLTAAVLAVAALHDTARCHLYATCVKEYKRLVANAMFERNIDMEYLRALVIGAYWLSDISWTLSGYAIRRASEFHLKQCYLHIAESVRSPGKTGAAKLEEAMDGIRVLYLLYVCDHQLSILYGRSSIMRDNETYITGWESYVACSLATDADRRIAGQICLMYLMNQMRETLGPEDVSTVLPMSALGQIASFERDLDDWIARFSRHNPSQFIGNWPNKGAIMHYHWAKLYLQSYVLRGLPDSGAVIPEHFVENASAAVQAATTIINLLIEDKDAHVAIGFVPHHIHGMVAFAAMFLLKVATKHREQLFVDIGHFHRLIGGLADHFKQIDVGKDHLLHRMADGLDKMAESLGGSSRPRSRKQPAVRQVPPPAQAMPNVATASTTNGLSSALPDFSAGIDPNGLDFGDGALGLGMPFFDFEGTTLNGTSAWDFA
ncbi:hypothetical protein DV738_g545, partial [Chaetothyriales sp. CBS 135597]